MKEKSFAQELAALINRHGIDAKMNTNDWILADVAIDALNAYGKSQPITGKNGKRPGTGERRLRLPGVYIAPSLTRESPTQICGTCRYFNPEFPVNGKPAPVCLAIKEMKGGTEYTNPRGTQHYFRCSNGRYENGIGQ